MKLIENGKSEYVIIRGKTACERFAAGELQKFIFQSSGAELPIVNKKTSARFISVGDTFAPPLTKKAVWKKNTSDGIYIKEENGNLYITGKRSRSVLYAVYDFLEKFFGVRFISSDETFVPKQKDVNVGGVEVLEEPSFDIRSFYTVQMENNSLYTARLRQVALYNREYSKYGFGLKKDGNIDHHNVFELLDYDTYYPLHPEWFHLELVENGVPLWDLCWSQGIDEDGDIIIGGSADILSDKLIEKIKSYPASSWFSVCQNDVPNGCECPLCLERRKKFGKSGILLRYVNAVARKIEKWRKENCPEREIHIVTFAYAFSQLPPLDEKGNALIRPEKNVWMWIATAEQNNLYACDEVGQNPIYTSLMEGWSKITDRFCYWDYRINFAEYLFYFPGLRLFEKDFRYLEKLGVKYLFCQAASGCRKDTPVWLNEIKGYVASKLMWNTSLSAENLIREFCELYYKDGAKTVLKIINAFEDNFLRVRKENPNARVFLLLGYRTVESDYYPVKMLKDAISDLKKEIARCKDEQVIKRLKNVLCTPERMLLRNYSQYYPNDAAGKEKLYKEFIGLCEELHIKILGAYEFTLTNLKKYPDYNWWDLHGVAY